MENRFCEHVNLTAKFDVPFDVKSGKATRFGSVYQCDDCGLSLVNPRPEASEVPAHYDLPKYYTHGASHIPEVKPLFLDRLMMHLAWRTDRENPFDPSQLLEPDAKGRKALDIGCGSGNLLSSFAEMGMDTFGVDPDEEARLEAEKKGHRVFPGAAESIPEELVGDKFDVITMTHVLEHCLNPAKALQNARELLSKEGAFYCEVPNAGSSYFQTYGQISEMLDVPRHLYFFRKSDLDDLASAAGLKIVRWHYRGLTRHFAASWKNWENSIYDQLVEAGVETTCERRSMIGDLKLLSTGIFKPRESRYDCIGFVARVA